MMVEIGNGNSFALGKKVEYTNWAEKSGTDEITMSVDGISGIRIFEGPWSERRNFIRDLVGYSEESAKESVTYYPDLMPEWEDDELACISAKGVGKGPIGATSELYDKCLVRAQYSPQRIEPIDDVVWEEEIDFREERWHSSKINPDEQYRWTDKDGDIVQQNIPLVVHCEILKYRLARVSALSVSTVRAYVGAVNSAVFKPLNQSEPSFAVGTVLFDGATARRQKLAMSGAQPYEVVLIFKTREESWNKAYRNSKEKWTPLFPVPFETADLTQIFTTMGSL